MGQDNDITAEYFELLMTWFVAAAYEKSGKPVLKVEMLTAATAAPLFQEWVKIRLCCTMGREENVPLSPIPGDMPAQGPPLQDLTTVVVAGIAACISQGHRPQRTG